MSESSRPARGTSPWHEPSDVASLIADLAHPDGVRRECARRALVRIGKPAVPELTRLLRAPRRQMRWEAAKALGRIADISSAPALVHALEDKDSDVRWLAAVGLVAIGPDALPPLLRALLEQRESNWLWEGAHHVCHDLCRRYADKHACRMLAALNTPEPDLAVAPAAHAVLSALEASRGPGPPRPAGEPEKGGRRKAEGGEENAGLESGPPPSAVHRPPSR
jgi:hypothetical protein